MGLTKGHPHDPPHSMGPGPAGKPGARPGSLSPEAASTLRDSRAGRSLAPSFTVAGAGQGAKPAPGWGVKRRRVLTYLLIRVLRRLQSMARRRTAAQAALSLPLPRRRLLLLFGGQAPVRGRLLPTSSRSHFYFLHPRRSFCFIAAAPPSLALPGDDSRRAGAFPLELLLLTHACAWGRLPMSRQSPLRPPTTRFG